MDRARRSYAEAIKMRTRTRDRDRVVPVTSAFANCSSSSCAPKEVGSVMSSSCAVFFLFFVSFHNHKVVCCFLVSASNKQE